MKKEKSSNGNGLAIGNTMNVKITLTSPMLGTVAKSKDLVGKYIESKRPADVEGPPETDTVEDLEEYGWTGFHKDSGGLFVYDYLVKGQLKNAANVLKDIKNFDHELPNGDVETIVMGVKACRSKLSDCVFVRPRKIYLGKQEPDDILERSIRVMTMRGPRTSLVRSDYVDEGTKFEFTLAILPQKDITVERWKEIIRHCLNYGQYIGYGQWRNGGYGQFEYEIAE